MTTIFCVVLGLLIGAGIAEEEGSVIGLFIGLAFGMIASLKGRIFRLEQELARISKLLTPPREYEYGKAKTTDIKSTENTLFSEQGLTAEHANVELSNDDKQVSLNSRTHDSSLSPSKAITESDTYAWIKSEQKTSSNPDLAQRIFFAFRDFFTTGNVVVKVGAIILFFGVAFLLKYAADRSLLPIEFRLLAVIAVSIVILIIGWRLRAEKLEYGLILQGTGVGLLYLTVFAASKLYQIFPVNLSFGIMLVLVALSGLLAVKQNAKSLALFGSTGGFLAPILMSTGSGSHISLFSYYALLNIGIFAIAWFKSWRELNLLGFFFTFAISAAWGYKAYLPEHFISTESFLILFYVFYLIIPILFAFKQAPKLKGYVDGTLVFGLPLIAFALQNGLVDQFEFGQAITAGIMAVIYFLLVKLFWNTEKDGFRLLAESYLALALTFASLAVPLALDNRWTAAVWSLEGAGLVWLGLRQSHVVSRLFGVILSVGAGMVFLASTYKHLPDSLPVLNSAYIGMILVSLSALFISFLYHKYQQRTYSLEREFTVTMIIWGLLWWFYAGITEINRFVEHHYELKLSIVFIALTTFVQIVISHKLRWVKLSLSAFLFTPVIVLMLLSEFVFYNHLNPMAYIGYFAWPVVLFVHFLVLRRRQDTWPHWMLTTWHALGVVFIAFITTWAVADWIGRIQILSASWVTSSIGLILALVIWSLLRWGHKSAWPVQQYPRAYYSLGLLPIIVILVFWQVYAATTAGNPLPLVYIPILNPLDLAQGLAIVTSVYWLWFINKFVEHKSFSISPSAIALLTAAMGFVWINIIIARSVHAFGHVDYSDYAMMTSSLYQASTSIVWSVIAMGLMLVAYRRSSRQFWFSGAGLLVIVVAKLFFIDLADSGSIARIVSFLAVGGLMLVIGYLSPLPPKITTSNDDTDSPK